MLVVTYVMLAVFAAMPLLVARRNADVSKAAEKRSGYLLCLSLAVLLQGKTAVAGCIRGNCMDRTVRQHVEWAGGTPASPEYCSDGEPILGIKLILSKLKSAP